MGYTQRKIRGINRSFFLAALAFAGWALFCAWTGWPRSFHHGAAAGFLLFLLAAIFFAAFPVIWARYPEKHPVNHELRRYGKLRDISERLDAEMAGPVERIGPFHFTADFLIYDSGHEFQMLPYNRIASMEVASDEGTAAVVAHTLGGRTYQWYSTWMQGRFNPEKVRERIRSAAGLDGPPAGGETA